MKKCTGMLVALPEIVVSWRHAVEMGTDITLRQEYKNASGSRWEDDNLCLRFSMLYEKVFLHWHVLSIINPRTVYMF